MTPDQLGYVKCESCGCWRKPEDVRKTGIGATVCRDDEQCDVTFRSLVTEYFPRDDCSPHGDAA